MTASELLCAETACLNEGALSAEVTVPSNASGDHRLHPLALPGNISGAAGMKAGERFTDSLSGADGTADEFLPEGIALVTFDNGLHGELKWAQMVPKVKGAAVSDEVVPVMVEGASNAGHLSADSLCISAIPRVATGQPFLKDLGISLRGLCGVSVSSLQSANDMPRLCNCLGPQPGQTKCPCQLLAEYKQGQTMIDQGVVIGGQKYKLVPDGD
jgi:hypothetical protein